MEKMYISNSSHVSRKENNKNVMKQIEKLIWSEIDKNVFNYFNSDKIYIDDTDGFISFQPTCVEGFYEWLTNNKIKNIVKFVNKYVEPTNIWIGSLLVQEV